MMLTFRRALPLFADEVSQGLFHLGHPRLSREIGDLEIVSRCSCELPHCGTFLLAPGAPLTELDGVSSSGQYRWIDVRVSKGNVGITLDREGRVQSVEVFARPDVRESLLKSEVPVQTLRAAI